MKSTGLISFSTKSNSNNQLIYNILLNNIHLTTVSNTTYLARIITVLNEIVILHKMLESRFYFNQLKSLNLVSLTSFQGLVSVYEGQDTYYVTFANLLVQVALNADDGYDAFLEWNILQNTLRSFQ